MTQPNTIRTLSDSELLHRLHTLAERERKTTLEILLHLSEIERRGLYLTQGYPSLFCYCTGHLGYSESAASRRIRTARCIEKFPEVRGLMVKNEVNVSTISMVARILTNDNKKTLLQEICGRSKRQVEVIVSRYKPERVVRDRVRPVAIIKSGPCLQDSSDSGCNASSTHDSTEKWLEIYRRCYDERKTAAVGNTHQQTRRDQRQGDALHSSRCKRQGLHPRRR